MPPALPGCVYRTELLGTQMTSKGNFSGFAGLSIVSLHLFPLPHIYDLVSVLSLRNSHGDAWLSDAGSDKTVKCKIRQ